MNVRVAVLFLVLVVSFCFATWGSVEQNGQDSISYKDIKGTTISEDTALSDEEKSVFDCGVNTLYLVLRLKGLDANLDEIRAHLPRDAEKGSSVHDLEVYLHSVGIKTDARLMRLSDLCKQQGRLAILLTQKEEGMGHFVVANVFPSGELQIIDSLLGARIEKDASKNKTKIPVILIDPEGSEWTWKLFAYVSVSLLGCLVWGNKKRFFPKTQRTRRGKGEL
jgi:ABC-type bacteriocin/lantibiotic exporters, contain an N-terminal double-glycine peptidase domain